jgi:hypothetical protein
LVFLSVSDWLEKRNNEEEKKRKIFSLWMSLRSFWDPAPRRVFDWPWQDYSLLPPYLLCYLFGTCLACYFEVFVGL